MECNGIYGLECMEWNLCNGMYEMRLCNGMEWMECMERNTII